MGPPGAGKTTFGFDLLKYIIQHREQYFFDGSKRGNLVLLFAAWTKIAVEILIKIFLTHFYDQCSSCLLLGDDGVE
eukprot:12400716-Karenia_brevis.AAC.1